MTVFSIQHVVPAEPTSSALPEIVSGAPEALVTERTVRIYKPAKTSTQSGKHGSQLWVIDFDIIQDGDRWENALMGWASSADYMQSLRMKFTTKEEAVQFAENQGWTYAVQEPKKATFVKKAYADNYKYSAGPLRMIKTK
ncbi:ETC complex I subunit conserved region-domain-containing protein [Spinellus fusiger]|nr:ETC complex I subunit conserved region-domain-containing protein [Spinellus fusiger]